MAQHSLFDPPKGTYHSDNRYYTLLQPLRNADPILRNLAPGHRDTALSQMKYDPHVRCQIQVAEGYMSTRKWQIRSYPQPHDDPAKALACEQLCKWWANNVALENGRTWEELLWNIGGNAHLYGISVHEMDWMVVDSVPGLPLPSGQPLVLPMTIRDLPSRRFRRILQEQNLELRLLTRYHPFYGIPLGDPARWLVSLHQSSYDFPEGEALLSSIYWVWQLKQLGVERFAQAVKIFGVPWFIYEVDKTTWSDDFELSRAKKNLIEGQRSAALVKPDTHKVSNLNATGFSNANYPLDLVEWADTQISKAMSGATLTTEISGQGSFAAAKTHETRENAVFQIQANIARDGMNDILKRITVLNFGRELTPPVFEFFKEPTISERTQEATFIDLAINRLRLPVNANHVYERLGIPRPSDNSDDILLPTPIATAPSASLNHSFAEETYLPDDSEDQLLEAADDTDFEKITDPILRPYQNLPLGELTDTDIRRRYSASNTDLVVSSLERLTAAGLIGGEGSKHGN